MDFGRVITAIGCCCCWPPRFGSLLFGALLLIAGATPLEASLVLPELPEFRLPSDDGGAGGTEAGPTDETSRDAPQGQVLASHILLVGNAYGRISTSAPTNGSLGLSLYACQLPPDPALSDLQVVERLSGKRRPTLPIPPPSKLWRPPQLG